MLDEPIGGSMEVLSHGVMGVPPSKSIIQADVDLIIVFHA